MVLVSKSAPQRTLCVGHWLNRGPRPPWRLLPMLCNSVLGASGQERPASRLIPRPTHANPGLGWQQRFSNANWKGVMPQRTMCSAEVVLQAGSSWQRELQRLGTCKKCTVVSLGGPGGRAGGLNPPGDPAVYSSLRITASRATLPSHTHCNQPSHTLCWGSGEGAGQLLSRQGSSQPVPTSVPASTPEFRFGYQCGETRPEVLCDLLHCPQKPQVGPGSEGFAPRERSGP